MKRINLLLWFGLIGLFSGTLCADALQESLPNQTQASEQKMDLSWPMAKLLNPSYKWQKHSEVAEKCLLIGRLDAKDPTAMHLLYTVNLSGERFAGAISPGGLNDWNFNAPIKDFGYTHQIPIPDKGVLLEGQQTALPHGNLIGYIKRSQKNFRLILISTEDIGDCYSQTASYSDAPCTPPKVEVFVSNITSLEQILKEPSR